MLKSLIKLPDIHVFSASCVKPCMPVPPKMIKPSNICNLTPSTQSNTKLPTTPTPPNASEQCAILKPTQQRKTSIPNTLSSASPSDHVQKPHHHFPSQTLCFQTIERMISASSIRQTRMSFAFFQLLKPFCISSRTMFLLGFFFHERKSWMIAGETNSQDTPICFVSLEDA
jgi:hypothetical protein